jgi:hypothetical protein
VGFDRIEKKLEFRDCGVVGEREGARLQEINQVSHGVDIRRTCWPGHDERAMQVVPFAAGLERSGEVHADGLRNTGAKFGVGNQDHSHVKAEPRKFSLPSSIGQQAADDKGIFVITEKVPE